MIHDDGFGPLEAEVECVWENNFALLGKSSHYRCKHLAQDTLMARQRTDTKTSLVMKLIVASIYTNYTTHIINDDGIEQLDSMVASPAGEKLVLGFNSIPKV